MKKYTWFIAILLQTLSWTAFSLSMGQLTVHSFLNQPLQAEIPLFDIKNIPIAGIKVRLAAEEDCEKIGLQPNEITASLRFKVNYNAQGQPVIAISSIDRITEPYLQVIIDVAWANGQLYRAYTLLLDPPNYRVNNSSAVKRLSLPANATDSAIVHYQHSEAVYGPTSANENIWQIAQRYATPDASIQQVILAIAGTNSEAFTLGNLNGLKRGEQLRIPSSAEISKIPAELAKQEVNAHDMAWQTQQAINHVLLPPYIDAKPGISQFDNLEDTILGESALMAVPEFKKSGFMKLGNYFSNLLPAAINSFELSNANKQASSLTPVKFSDKIKAEIEVASTVINAVKNENALLKEKIEALQTTNKKWQAKFIEQEEAIKQLNKQITRILINQGDNKQINPAQKGSNFWLYILLIIAIAAGVSIAYWVWQNELAEKEREHKKDFNEIFNTAVKSIMSVVNNGVEIAKTAIKKYSKQNEANSHQQEIRTVKKDNKLSDKIVTAEEKLSTSVNPVNNQPNNIKPDLPQNKVLPITETPVPKDTVKPQTIKPEPVKQSPEAHDNLLNFEPGLDKLLPQNKTANKIENKDDTAAGIDFTLDAANSKPKPAHTANAAENAAVTQPKHVKSTDALNTLLALANTYIGMEDFEAAKQSLQEVIDFGDESQKTAARNLLLKLESK